MGYISADAVSIATSTSIDQYRSVAGRSTIEIAAAQATEAATEAFTGANWKAVGALDGAVSITPNHDVVKLQSSALQNPYAVIDTAYDYQVSFTLQEVDLHNYALALGNKEGAVVTDTLGTNTDITSGRVDLKAGLQSAYRAMRIVTLAANTSSAEATQVMLFYKVRIQATGSFDYDRTGAVSIPVTAHCLGTSNDRVGVIFSGVTVPTRGYGV